MGLPPLPGSSPAPGAVPATFRSEPAGDPAGPRLGALSLSAVLAVALAALRGTVGVVQDWRQRRLERQAETAPLRAARLRAEAAEMRHGTTPASSGAGRGGGRVPSSHDWGRRTVGGGGGRSAAGGSGGSVPSRSTRSTPTSSSAAGKGGSGTRTGSGSVSGPRTGRTSGGKHGPTGSGGSRTSPSSGAAGSSSTAGPRSGGGGTSPGTGGGKQRPKKLGLLGQLAVERSQRRSAREAAAQQQAARQHKADLAAARKRKGGQDGSGAGGGKAGGSDTADQPGTETAPGKTERPEKGTQADRITLGQAVTEEAARRFEERRAEGLRHPWRADQDDPGPETPEQDADPAEKPGPSETGSADQAPPGDSDPEPDTGGSGAQEDASPEGDPFDDGGTGPGAAPPPPPGGGRRSAWESMQDAAAAADATDVTVESLHVPGDSTRRARYARAASHGLPVAEPGTTSTTTTPREAPVSAPLPAPGPAGAEHLTEITLDDVLDALSSSKGDCFATYDQCAVLADQAVELRAALAELAEELAAHHNVVGRATSAAMDRLAESMDVLARRAEEMRGESLHAAEAVETAHDAMHDAYRPVQTAAADAGLEMPSARIHNEE